ncbi:MAG: hypothetical protein AAFV07_12470, partial [Bacteroidota bacterium]
YAKQPNSVMKNISFTLPKTILSLSFFMILLLGDITPAQAQITILVDDLIGKIHAPTSPIFQPQINRPNSPTNTNTSRPLITKATVYDSKGNKVYIQQLPGSPSVTIPALPTGTYVVAVQTTVGLFHVHIQMP